jgi:fructose-1,6-bisphosphatase I
MTGNHRIMTVQQHIMNQQQIHSPDSEGKLSWLLSGMTLATKMIESRVRRAGLLDILGAAGLTNVQGEQQQKLDAFANHALIHCLGARDMVAVLVSEENEEPVTFDRDAETGRYIVIFDPLDGSSNIDVNVSVGTIFSIFRRLPEADGNLNDSVLQCGYKQVAAGYVVYGSSTMFVYTAGHGVFGFTLDPAVGAYVLSHENMRMPEKGSYYSVNEANERSFPAEYQAYLQSLRSGSLGQYSSRYIGSLVADFHRTLLKGGVFLYPPTASHPNGKLRLLYEANPMAFIAEQAGGIATDGVDRILELEPKDIHQRTPLALGSRVEMEEFERVCGAQGVAAAS